jgi:hypothetical protein
MKVARDEAGDMSCIPDRVHSRRRNRSMVS